MATLEAICARLKAIREKELSQEGKKNTIQDELGAGSEKDTESDRVTQTTVDSTGNFQDAVNSTTPTTDPNHSRQLLEQFNNYFLRCLQNLQAQPELSSPRCDASQLEKQSRSMQFNFIRFGSREKCSFESCPFKQSQTHYHCIEVGCRKICLTTTELQFHYNCHAKAVALERDGFRRYRGNATCSTPDCPFSEEATTHYHCLRADCRHTFKNKSDIEKHKEHHAKNDELRDRNVRKYYKYESCCVPTCSLSRKSNHLHCLEPGCHAVLSSSTQIDTHRFRHASLLNKIKSTSNVVVEDTAPLAHSVLAPIMPEASSLIISSTEANKWRRVRGCEYDFGAYFKNQTRRYTANDVCRPLCPLLYKDHYHCLANGGQCSAALQGKERLREHGRAHAGVSPVPSSSSKSPPASSPTDLQTEPLCLKRKSDSIDASSTLTKRRGRPAKIRQLPIIPHPHLPTEDWNEISLPMLSFITIESFRQSANHVLAGFKLYEETEGCQDYLCMFDTAPYHFHCVRPRCHCAVDALHEVRHHVINFHAQICVPEGFECFGFQVNCRRPSCQYNKTKKHYHCTRARCDAAFSREKSLPDHLLKQHSPVVS